MTSTEDAFVRTAGATIKDSTANGFTGGSMQTFSPKEPRTRRHVSGRQPHAVDDGHAPSPPASRLRVSQQARLDTYAWP